MTGNTLSVRDVTVTFGAFRALEQVSLDLRGGEKIGIIGPNGCGKTTLINTISGQIRGHRGSISFDGADITALEPHLRTRLGIARSFQIPRPFRQMTVVENVCIPLQFVSGASAAAAREQASEYLAMLGLGAKAEEDCHALTQVDLRKLELARAMACDPRLLLVDEAMAGLSSAEVDEILRILEALAAKGVTVVMVEHIMHAINAFSSRILCFVAGRLVADGTPAEVMANPEVRRAYLGH